jgi:hypothetical protein
MEGGSTTLARAGSYTTAMLFGNSSANEQAKAHS